MNFDLFHKNRADVTTRHPFHYTCPLPWQIAYIRKTDETILGRPSPDDIFNVIVLRPSEQNKNVFCMYEKDDSFMENFFVPALVQALRRGDSLVICTSDTEFAEKAKQLCLDNNRNLLEPGNILRENVGSKVLSGNCMAVLNPKEEKDPLYAIFCDAMYSGALDKGGLHVMIDDVSSLPVSEAVIYHTVTTQARWTIGCTSVESFFSLYTQQTAETVMHRCMTHLIYDLTGEAEARYFAKRAGQSVCPPADRVYICAGRGRYPTLAYKFNPKALAFQYATELDEGIDVEPICEDNADRSEEV